MTESNHLPAIVQPTALAASVTDTHLVPALIADLGELALRRILRRQHPQFKHAACLCACV
jgi:hypothetical protein